MAHIPRRKLFGNPDRMAPRISPDGQWIGWTAPASGLAAARPLTASAPPLHSFAWAFDGCHIL